MKPKIFQYLCLINVLLLNTLFLFAQESQSLQVRIDTDAVNNRICSGRPEFFPLEASVIGGTEPYYYEWTFTWNNDTLRSREINIPVETSGEVRLKISDSSQPSNTKFTQYSIKEVFVSADFDFITDTVCAQSPVKFNSVVSGGTPHYIYSWNFGDGKISNLKDPTHEFIASGCYGLSSFDVEMRVTDADGCASDYVNKTITFKNKPFLNFADINNPSSPFKYCRQIITDPTFMVKLENRSRDTTCISSYNINWGDGNIENNASFPIEHTYNQIGAFKLVVTAGITNGCDLIWTKNVYIQSNPGNGIESPIGQSGCAPTEYSFLLHSFENNSIGTTYTWNFGDGSPLVVWDHNDPHISNVISHVYERSSCEDSPYSGFITTVIAENGCYSKTAFTDGTFVWTKPSASIEDDDLTIDTICTNQIIELTNNSINGYAENCATFSEFFWDFGNGKTSTDEAMPPMSWDVPGDYYVSLNMTNECGSTEDSFKIVVLDPPVPNVLVDDTVGCAPFAPKFENNSTGSKEYLWKITPNSGYTFLNGTNIRSREPEISFERHGVYRLVLYVRNACQTDSTFFNFNVYNKPEGTIKNLSNVCITNPVIHPLLDYNDNGDSVRSFSWSFPGAIPSDASVKDPGEHAYAAAGNYPVHVVLENNCGSTFLTDVIYVHPVPEFWVNTPASICESDPLDISGTTINHSTSFWWESMGDGRFNDNSLLNPTYSPGSNDLINSGAVLQIIANGISPCQSDTATLTLNIQKNPFVWAGQDVTICEGQEYENLQAIADNYDSLKWSTQGDGHFSDPYILNPVYYPGNTDLSAGNAELILTAHAKGPCTKSVSDTFRITYAKAPKIDAGRDDSICLNGQVSLTAAGNGYTSVSWHVENGKGSFGNPASLNTFFTLSPGVTDNLIILHIEATGGHGCPNVYDSLELSVILPPVVFAGKDDTVCAFGTYSLIGASLQNHFYSFWKVNGDGMLNNYSVQNPVFTPGLSDIANGQVTLTLFAKGDSVCPVISDEINISIQKLPESNAGTDQDVCKSNNYITAGQQTNGASILWKTLGTGSFGNDALLATTYYPSAFDKNNGTVELVLIVNPMSPCFVPDHDTVKLTFIDPPVVFAGNDTVICSSSFVPVNAYSNNSTQFEWSSGGNGTFSNENTLKPTYYPSASDVTNGYVILTLTSKNPSCPEVSDEMVLTLTPFPVANAGSDDRICEDAVKSLLDSYSANFSSLEWKTTGDGNFNDTTILHPSYSPGINDINTGSVKLYLIVKGIPPCNIPEIDSMTLSLQKNPVVYAGADTIIGEGEVFTAIGATAENVNQLRWSTLGDGTFLNGTDTISTYLPGKNDLINKGVKLIIRGTSFSPCFKEATDTMIVIITPKPKVYAGSDETICEGSSITILKASAEEYSEIWWTHSGSGALNDNSTLTPTYIPSNEDITNRVVELILHARGKNPIEYFIVSDTMRVQIIHNAYVDLIQLDTACENFSYQIRDIVYNDVDKIFWSSSGDGNFDGTGKENPLYNFSSNDIYKDTLYFYVQVNSLTPCAHVHFDTMMIRLFHEPEPAFAYDPPEGCAPLPVRFTNLSAGEELTYKWNFGNGQESIDENPGVIIFQQGRTADTTYTITLTATNRCNSHFLSSDIIVKPIPIAQFGMDVSWGCSPKEIFFYNVTTGLADTYLWKWGDGKAHSMEEQPGSHIFETDDFDTSYTITLTATNQCGVDSMRKSVIIFPNTVEAFFETDTTFGCAPFEVKFTNYSRGVLGNKPFLNWSWNFGDGNITDELHPKHVFKKPGKYAVTLYVNDTCSYNSFTTEINVMGAPRVDFVTDKTDYCEHDTVFVTPVNMPLNEIASVTWDFGDSNKGFNFNDQHVYDTTGVFNIFLTAKDIINGCTSSTSREIYVHQAPVAAFSIPDNDGCQPLKIIFLNKTIGGDYFAWDYANGNSSVEVNGQQLFTKPGSYNITLRATNKQGCTDEVVQKVLVNPKPVAAFESSSLQTCFPPVDVEFINTSEGADDYRWDFGNGNLSKDTNPVINYSEYGDYAINMIATNKYFCSDTSEIVYHVYHNPVADFTVDTTIGCDPFMVPFINLSEYGLEYHWNFEEQGYSEDEEPVFTFEGAGTYNVSLRVVGPGGCNDSIYKEDFITTNPSPISYFEYSRIKEIDTVQFHNFSSGAVSYLWNFGDGLSSGEDNPWHKYKYYGTYNVSLTTINEYECTNTMVEAINFELFKGLFLPNAFSPGNASVEVREFKAVGMGLYKYHLVVYDAWGNLIWETTRLDRGVPAEAWDGALNGKPLHPDVYVWHLKEAIFRDGTSYEGKRYGSITLIK